MLNCMLQLGWVSRCKHFYRRMMSLDGTAAPFVSTGTTIGMIEAVDDIYKNRRR